MQIIKRVPWALIGGSGFGEMRGFEIIDKIERARLITPFGYPSSDITIIAPTLDCANRFVLLKRHGNWHYIFPHEINYRANAWALRNYFKVRYAIGGTAVGGLNHNFSDRMIAIIDQMVNKTDGRARSLFSKGCVSHVSFAYPICETLRKILIKCLKACVLPHQTHATVATVNGPEFGTRAQSYEFKQLGYDLVGMTQYQEALFMRWCNICYASLGLVTDLDAWADMHASVEKVLATMAENFHILVTIVTHLFVNEYKIEYEYPNPCQCDETLQNSFQTPLKLIGKTDELDHIIDGDEKIDPFKVIKGILTQKEYEELFPHPKE